MTKLLTAFQTKPSVDTAKRLVSYLDKHPMAECMANEADRVIIGLARSYK